MKVRFLKISILVLISCGCGQTSEVNEAELPDYSDDPVSGILNNAKWTYVSGHAEDIVSADGTKLLQVKLISDLIADTCSDEFVAQDHDSVNFSAPVQPGEHFYSERNDITAGVTVSNGDAGFTATSTSAKVRLISIMDDQVLGKFYFRSRQGSNEVNGSFQVPRCRE